MVAAALEIDDDLPIVRYTINATPSTGPFAVPFPLPTDYATALKVAIDGAETTDWTFAPDSDVAGGYPTGEVTLTYAQSNCQVTIWRRLPLERTVDYANGPLDMAGLNAELAYVIMRLQDTRLRATQVWRTGSGAPADADGLDGDMYINVTNGDLYGPKALGVWGSAVGNLVDDVSAAAIAAAAAAAVTTHVALADPHTQYLLESAVSANGLTLIGHTFAQMRTDLSLVVGVDVQAYDANTAKLNAAQSWTQAQNYAGIDVTSGNLQSSNGFHIYFSSNVTYLRSLQNGVAWRGAEFDASTLTINGSSGGALIIAGDNPTRFSRPSSSFLIEFYNSSATRGYVGADSTKDFIVYDSGGGEDFSINNSTGNATFAGAIAAGGPVNLKAYTVAGLPAGSAGDTAYASNGRKNGEGAGLGTGVLVFKDGTAWRACDTGATVAA